MPVFSREARSSPAAGPGYGLVVVLSATGLSFSSEINELNEKIRYYGNRVVTMVARVTGRYDTELFFYYLFGDGDLLYISRSSPLS